MDDQDLARRLRRLRRTVDMLQSDLRQHQVNEKLLAEIETHMDHGISTEHRCEKLRPAVDALRESTLTPRRELLTDTIRAGEKLKHEIEGVLGALG